jgi:hypothetical protein
MWSTFLCAVGFHRWSPVSVARRRDQTIALCEHCGCPLVRASNGRWQAADPL